MLLTGKYEHSIDDKQRLAIPAELRSRLEAADDAAAMYAMAGVNGALWLWPERTFERMAGDISPSLLPAAELMDFDELTFPESRRIEFDKAGRLRVPEEMLREAGLAARVVILGVRDHLELRDPEDWERRRQEKRQRRVDIIRGARSALGGTPRADQVGS